MCVLYSCRPMSGPYWYGLLLIGGMFLLLTVILIIMFPVHLKYGHTKKANYSKYIALIAVSLCFYLAWGFVLPATRPLYLGAVRIVFEIIFIVCSSLLGLLMILFYCFLTEVRQIYCQRCAHTRQSYGVTESPVEDENLYVMTKKDTETGIHFANLGADAPPPDYETVTDGVKRQRSPGATGGGDDTQPEDTKQEILSNQDAAKEADTTF